MELSSAISPRSLLRVFSGVALWCAVATAGMGGDQKLVLTDGSDQVVRSYEIVGDRVRYLSAERMEWEEIPKEPVDWKATEAAKQAAEQAIEEARAKAEEIKPRVLVEASAVAPRLLMPEQEGVYLLSTSSSVTSRTSGLTRLNQIQGIVENDKKRSLLSLISPVPIVKGKATILLPGKAARTEVRPQVSAIYIMISPEERVSERSPTNAKEPDAAPQPSGASSTKDTARESSQEHSASVASPFAIVRVRTKGDERVVGEITISPLGGAMSESRDVVPAAFEMAFPAVVDADGDSLPVVWRLTPRTPLEPGEYALVEFVDHERQNLFVWDFRVSAGGKN